MRVHENNKLVITMNPKELRDLADKMEEVYPKIMWGDSTFVDIISHEPMIVLHADQEYFRKLKSENTFDKLNKEKV